jgi:hypothetical protein
VIIGIVISVEWGLLDKLTKEEGPSFSVRLLAAIVIIVGLLILSMTAFKRSPEDYIKN